MLRKLFLSLLILLAFSNMASAETHYITAEGRFVMGDNDTRNDAKKAAIKDAMRSAVEQAGVYVESYSESQNMQLTRDEVNVVAAGIVKVISENVTFNDDGTVCIASIYASACTDGIDLEKLMRAYRKKSDAYGAVPHYTALVIDYGVFKNDPYRYTIMKAIGDEDYVVSEAGEIIYDARVHGAVFKPGRPMNIFYHDHVYDRILARAGANPLKIYPVGIKKRKKGAYYRSCPIISNEDAELIKAVNRKYGFLRNHQVYIYSWQ